MVKAGQYKGKQYGIPEDWGFDAILYRTDKVKPKAKSWSLLFDERYKGKIAWFDDLSTMLADAGVYLGFKNPWNQTDAQLKESQKFLISKKHLVRDVLGVRDRPLEAFGSGDIWIAYAWPNDWVQMKKKGLKVVYMHPKEKRDLLDRHAHARSRDRRVPSSRTRTPMPGAPPRAATWLEDNYGYGHSNLARPAVVERPAEGAQLDEPEARWRSRTRTSTATSRGATLYAKLWEEVKAS